jgi:hypothetical protein
MVIILVNNNKLYPMKNENKEGVEEKDEEEKNLLSRNSDDEHA